MCPVIKSIPSKVLSMPTPPVVMAPSTAPVAAISLLGTDGPRFWTKKINNTTYDTYVEFIPSHKIIVEISQWHIFTGNNKKFRCIAQCDNNFQVTSEPIAPNKMRLGLKHYSDAPNPMTRANYDGDKVRNLIPDMSITMRPNILVTYHDGLVLKTENIFDGKTIDIDPTKRIKISIEGVTEILKNPNHILILGGTPAIVNDLELNHRGIVSMANDGATDENPVFYKYNPADPTHPIKIDTTFDPPANNYPVSTIDAQWPIISGNSDDIRKAWNVKPVNPAEYTTMMNGFIKPVAGILMNQIYDFKGSLTGGWIKDKLVF